MIIDKLKPIEFKKALFNLLELEEEIVKRWQCGSSEKATFYYCLKSLILKGTVLVSVYFCSSVLEPLARL